MHTLQEIVSKLQDRNIKMVADKTGISYLTILNIKRGKHVNPTISTISKLSDYFKEN